jgi:hypothetical protein
MLSFSFSPDEVVVLLYSETRHPGEWRAGKILHTCKQFPGEHCAAIDKQNRQVDSFIRSLLLTQNQQNPSCSLAPLQPQLYK